MEMIISWRYLKIRRALCSRRGIFWYAILLMQDTRKLEKWSGNAEIRIYGYSDIDISIFNENGTFFNSIYFNAPSFSEAGLIRHRFIPHFSMIQRILTAAMGAIFLRIGTIQSCLSRSACVEAIN